MQISLQNSSGKVVFYGWSLGTPPPWAPTGVKVPWSLSGNMITSRKNESIPYKLIGLFCFLCCKFITLNSFTKGGGCSLFCIFFFSF